MRDQVNYEISKVIKKNITDTSQLKKSYLGAYHSNKIFILIYTQQSYREE